MPQPEGSGPSSTIVVDIPGIGAREFPATMPIAQIRANAVALMQGTRESANEWDAPALNRSPAEARVRGFAQGAREAAGKVLTPEVTGGLAGLGVAAMPGTFGASSALAIPAAVASGTSLVRDYLSGEHPSTMLNDAVGHGAVNAIPGLAELPGAKAGLGRAAGALVGGKSGILKSLLSLVGRGGEAAAPAAAAHPLEGATLPFGEKVLSPEGLQVLKGYARDMAMKGKTMADPTFEALSTMIRHVEDHVGQAAKTPTGLAQAAGVPLTYAADAATAAGQAMKQRIALALRAVLGGASLAKQQSQPPMPGQP